MDDELKDYSEFFSSFIYEYSEYHSYLFSSIDRLNFILCDSEEAKGRYLEEVVKDCDAKIKELGYEELSFAYVQAHKFKKNEPSEGFYITESSFWLNRFAEHFLDSINSFTEIKRAALIFFEEDTINDFCFENEEAFWINISQYLTPKIKDLERVIKSEMEFVKLLEYDKSVFEEEGFFDYIENSEGYKRFQEIVPVVDLLFKHCDLYFYLERRFIFYNLKLEKRKDKLVAVDDVLGSLISVCSKMQSDIKYRGGNSDENDRNRYIANLLEQRLLGNYIVKDQPQWGHSATGKNRGEVDIFISDANGIPVSIIEGLVINSLSKKSIHEHIERIFKYDTTGLYANFVLVYSTAKKFDELCFKYSQYIDSSKFQYPFKPWVELKKKNHSSIRIGLTEYHRDSSIHNLYHIIVDMTQSS
jgi:hypothetical protein